MNVADANGLLMVVAKVCFVAEKDNRMFHYSLCALDWRLKVKAVLLNSTLFNLSIEQN